MRIDLSMVTLLGLWAAAHSPRFLVAAEPKETMVAKWAGRITPTRIAFPRSMTSLAVGLSDDHADKTVAHQVRVFEVMTGKQQFQVDFMFPISALGYRLDGTLVTCVLVAEVGSKVETPVIQNWDRAGKEIKRFTLPVHDRRREARYFCTASVDGERLYTRAPGTTALAAYDSRSGEKIGSLTLREQQVVAPPAWSPDGKWLAIAYENKGIAVYDLRAMKKTAEYDCSEWSELGQWSKNLCFSPKGDQLTVFVSGSKQYGLHRIDALTGVAKLRPKPFSQNHVLVRWLPGGDTVVALDKAHGFALVDLISGTALRPAPKLAAGDNPTVVAVTRDASHVAWASSAGVHLWRLSGRGPEEP